MKTEELFKLCQNRFLYDKLTGKLTYKVTVGRILKGTEVRGKDDRGYLRVNISQKTYLVHRIIWLMMRGELPDTVDHDNRVRDDNRWVNLLNKTKRANNQNLSTPGLGIQVSVSGKYGLSKKVKGTSIYFGSFNSLEEATKVSLEIEEYLKDGKDILDIRRKYVKERIAYESTL